MKKSLLAVAAALSLAACQTAIGTTVTTALPQNMAANARIQSVVLHDAPTEGVSDTFAANFETGLRGELDKCAAGTMPLVLDITLTNFDKANPAMTFLVGDANRVSGVARLTDASGAVVGEYRISRQFTAGGWVGIAMMANAEAQMSAAFGAELCKRAFSEEH